MPTRLSGGSVSPTTSGSDGGFVNFLTSPIGGERDPDQFPTSLQVNPIQAAGLLLSNFAAGKQGRPLPTNQLLQQQQQNFLIQERLRQQKEEAKLRRLQIGFDNFATGIATLKNVPAGERQSFIDTFSDKLDQVAPGFGESFKNVGKYADFVDPKKFKQNIQNLPPETAQLVQTLFDSGRTEEAISLLTSATENAAKRSPIDNAKFFTGPDGTVNMVRGDDDGNIEIQQLGRLGKPSSQFTIKTNPDGSTEVIRGPVDQDKVDESFDTQQAITELGQLFRTVDEAGEGVTGLRGLSIDVIGGIAGQFSPELESAIAKGVGGVTPEEVKEFRTRARAQIAKLVPTFTGEEGARISERELQIAEIASSLLSPRASLTQIRTAIPLIMELKISDQIRQALERGEDPPFDLKTDSGINALGNRLMKFGIPQSQAVGMVRDLKEIQADLESLSRG